MTPTGATWREAMAWALEHIGLSMAKDRHGNHCWIAHTGATMTGTEPYALTFGPPSEPYTLLTPEPAPAEELPAALDHFLREQYEGGKPNIRSHDRLICEIILAEARRIAREEIEGAEIYTQNECDPVTGRVLRSWQKLKTWKRS